MSNDLLSNKLEELSQCKEIETFCVKLVYEFLLCNNFTKTIDVFTEEVKSSEFSLPEELPLKKERIEKDDVVKIISAMEIEDHLQFFEKWASLVPFSIKDLPEYKNITLPLYTYFATLPVRKEKKSHLNEKNQTANEVFESEKHENYDDNEKGKGTLSQLKIESLNSTFTVENSSIKENFIEVGYNSERDPDIEPDSLDSEVEVSDSEGKKKQKRKTLMSMEKQEDTVVICNQDNETKVDGTSTTQIKELIKENGDQLKTPEIKKKQEEGTNNGTKESSENETEFEAKLEDITDDRDDVPSAMAMFEDFLLEKKYSFNTEPQYLPLFALPFIQNPEEHEAFNQVFQDKWVKDLKESLFNFLIKFSCGDVVVPQIVKICKENKEYMNLLKKKNDNNDDYLKLYKESRRKLHKLKRDHKNLVGVAGELANALENSVRGEAVDIKSTLYKCITIFPELFPNAQISDSLHLNGDSTEKSNKEKAWIGLSHLDTKKIKDDLMNGSIKTKLLILQALRWGICEVDAEERERLVSWLGREDVLGLEGGEGHGRDWLARGEAHPLQQSLARLLNCVTSLRTGRDYVAGAEPPLIPVVATSLLRASSQDRITQDMLLALLQKLSLRKGMCDEMIKQGLLEWLSSRLGQSRSLYQLEYTTSLFMNLCIHAPVSYWDTRPHQVLPPLLKLLNTSVEQVLEFVLGSLYCLLRSDKLNIFARSVGLSGELSAVTSERCRRQAAELLKLHRRELSPATVRLPPTTLNEEDIEDPEEMEPEVNMDDPVKGTPSGNQLLTQHYRLIFPSPGMVGQRNDDRLRLRPSTPRAHQSLPAWAL